LQPDHLEIWRRLLELALRSRDNDKATQMIAEIRRIEGDDGVLWRLGEAAREIMLARNG